MTSIDSPWEKSQFRWVNVPVDENRDLVFSVRLDAAPERAALDRSNPVAKRPDRSLTDVDSFSFIRSRSFIPLADDPLFGLESEPVVINGPASRSFDPSIRPSVRPSDWLCFPESLPC